MISESSRATSLPGTGSPSAPDRHPLPRADEARDVSLRRMVRHAAHGNAVALGERHIQDARAGLRILEEHLVEVAETKQRSTSAGRSRRMARYCFIIGVVAVSADMSAQDGQVLRRMQSGSMPHDPAVTTPFGACHLPRAC